MVSRFTAFVGGVLVSRTGFFFVISIATLAIVLIAFAPTFYLRTTFKAPPIPAKDCGFARHRQLGVVEGFIGLGVAIMSLTVTPGVVSHFKQIGFDFTSSTENVPTPPA